MSKLNHRRNDSIYGLLNTRYTGSSLKIGLCPGSALNLNQAKSAPKQLNFLKLGDAGGFIFNGYLTQTKPIFELRAV